ncbi:MAG: HD domain-containing protein [Chlamydiota bacterium]
MHEWVQIIRNASREELKNAQYTDDSHSYGHLCRVSDLAVRFAEKEEAHKLTVFAAGMLHDIISLPKNHPESSKSSLLAANRAEDLLGSIGFPKELIPKVHHAIHAHSFSAKVLPETIEAKCLQDADRMEALGAFGLMRVFYCGGMYGAKILDEEDPLAQNRPLADKQYSLDHFEVKLLTLYKTMQTSSGRNIAYSLSEFLRDFRKRLVEDYFNKDFSSARFKIAQVYRNAGEQGCSLFHPEDQFCMNRVSNPSKYALDQFLDDKDDYIKEFLKQFSFEINGYFRAPADQFISPNSVR